MTWDDPNSSSVEVITEENIEQYHVPEVMKTVGWLLRDDEKGVSVCNETYLEHGKPRWRGHTFIQRSLIKSVKPYTSPSKRKPKNAKVPPVLPPDGSL